MKTEKIIAGLILIGFILFYFHVPGGALLTVLSLSAMATIYFGGGFYFFCDKHIKNQNIALSIVSGIFLSFIQIAILFKTMLWPGGEIQFYVGIIASPILLILTFIFKSKAKESLMKYYKNMQIRLIAWTSLAIIFYFIPYTSLVSHHYKNDPERARLLNQCVRYPNNLDYQKEYSDYLAKKDSLELHNANDY